ncbi:MAG: tripartite tricarboxylate transporter substrate binding protein [Burkholderiaceae bacterium]
MPALGLLPKLGQAQDRWPSKPIVYVVPFPAGGTTDILTRLIALKLGPALGTTVVVENKTGAAGGVGADYVAKAAPDGYTIVGGTISSHAINQTLYPKLPYDAQKSFEPIALIGTNANVLVVNAASPYKSVQDIVAAAKAKPGVIAYASSGSGSSQHMSGELFKSLAGIDLVHVPYRGSSPAIQDVMAGQVPMMFDTSVVAAPFIESGKLRALAVSSPKRTSLMPTVPTMDESGVKGFNVYSWQGVFAPAGTPQPIVQRLHDEIVKIISSAEMRERLGKLGMEGSDMTIEQFKSFQDAEIAKWAQVIKRAGLKVD